MRSYSIQFIFILLGSNLRNKIECPSSFLGFFGKVAFGEKIMFFIVKEGFLPLCVRDYDSSFIDYSARSPNAPGR
jgi:hypothetical protein